MNFYFKSFRQAEKFYDLMREMGHATGLKSTPKGYRVSTTGLVMEKAE